MSKGLGNILRQAQRMQERMGQIQEALATRTVEASSGGRMVTATVNGRLELLSIRIDPTAVNPQDIEMLQDLIVAAVNSAIRRSQEMVKEEMGKVAGELNIPGLF